MITQCTLEEGFIQRAVADLCKIKNLIYEMHMCLCSSNTHSKKTPGLLAVIKKQMNKHLRLGSNLSLFQARTLK